MGKSKDTFKGKEIISQKEGYNVRFNRKFNKIINKNMLAIIGLIMIYSWIHAVVINFKKLQGLTDYEKVVLWVALVGFALTMMGLMSN